MAQITCDACRDLLPWYAARLLSEDERDRVERHLATCENCRGDLAAWQQIASVTGDHLSRVTPSVTTADAWQRLQQHITPDPSMNGRRRGDTIMEFGNQPELIATSNISAHPAVRARRPMIAAVAALFIILFGAISFWYFAPKSHGGIDRIPATRVSATPTSGQGEQTPIQTPQMGKEFSTINNLPVIQNQTTHFTVGDDIIVVARVAGTKAGDVVSVKWYQNGTDLTSTFEAENANCCSVTLNGQPVAVEFQAQFPSKGSGKVELYYNSTLAYTLDFDVSMPQATPPVPPDPNPSATPRA